MPALIFAPLGWNRCCGNLPHYQSSRAKKCCNKNLAKEGPADHARHAPFVVRLLPSTRRVSHGGGRGATCGRGPLHAPFWYARVGLGVGYSQVSRTGGSARNWRSPALCPAFVTMPAETSEVETGFPRLQRVCFIRGVRRSTGLRNVRPLVASLPYVVQPAELTMPGSIKQSRRVSGNQ